MILGLVIDLSSMIAQYQAQPSLGRSTNKNWPETYLAAKKIKLFRFFWVYNLLVFGN